MVGLGGRCRSGRRGAPGAGRRLGLRPRAAAWLRGLCSWDVPVGCARGLCPAEMRQGGGAASGHAIGSRGAREALGSILSPAPPPRLVCRTDAQRQTPLPRARRSRAELHRARVQCGVCVWVSPPFDLCGRAYVSDIGGQQEQKIHIYIYDTPAPVSSPRAEAQRVWLCDGES